MPYIRKDNNTVTNKLVYVSGPPGSQGESGPQGPQGPGGSGSDFNSANITVSTDGTLGVGALDHPNLLKACVITLTSSAVRTIHGMLSDTTIGNMNPIKEIRNGNAPGGSDFILIHNSGSAASAKDRFNIIEGSSYTIRPGESVQFGGYDYLAELWLKTADSTLVDGELASVLATRIGKKDGEVRQCSGVSAVGVGAGKFRWHAGDSSTAVLGMVLGSGSGRWKRIYARGLVNAEWFGAVGDNVTDDSTAVQAAIDWLGSAGGGKLVLSSKYRCKGLHVWSKLTIEGSGPDTGFSQIDVVDPTTDPTGNYIILVAPTDGGDGDVANNVRGVHLRDFGMYGNVATEGFYEFEHLLSGSSASDVLVENVLFYGFRGDGACVASGHRNLPVGFNESEEHHNENWTFRKCWFDGVNKDNRQGISFIDVTGALVEDCTFVNCTRSNMPGAIDCEPNVAAYHRMRNVTIRKNSFSNIGGNVAAVSVILPIAQASMTTPASGFVIEDNTFDDCYFAVRADQGGHASSSTIPVGVVVRNNRGKNCTGGPWMTFGIRDIRFEKNTWTDFDNGCFVSYADSGSAERMVHDLYCDDTFVRCGKLTGSGLTIWRCTKSRVAALFQDCGLTAGPSGYGLSFGDYGTTSDTDVRGTRVIAGTKTTKAIVKFPNHTWSDTRAHRGSIFANGGLDVGGLDSDWVAAAPGEKITRVLSGFGQISGLVDGAVTESTPITVNGAEFGDTVSVSCVEALPAGLWMSAIVRATNTVVIQWFNKTGSTVTFPNPGPTTTYYLSLEKRPL